MPVWRALVLIVLLGGACANPEPGPLAEPPSNVVPRTTASPTARPQSPRPPRTGPLTVRQSAPVPTPTPGQSHAADRRRPDAVATLPPPPAASAPVPTAMASTAPTTPAPTPTSVPGLTLRAVIFPEPLFVDVTAGAGIDFQPGSPADYLINRQHCGPATGGQRRTLSCARSTHVKHFSTT